MAEYIAAAGHMVGDDFKAEGQTHRFTAVSDAEAIEEMWNWVGGLSALFPVTHARLSEVTGHMDRRVVGIWPIDQAPRKTP
ncbi:MAG TPA: hypothetical protein VH414_13990 [Lichenihabitans sp.]|jgi:hypothetical protein|nr:hypothetical protein [Lichenihabitans sp.]